MSTSGPNVKYVAAFITISLSAPSPRFALGFVGLKNKEEMVKCFNVIYEPMNIIFKVLEMKKSIHCLIIYSIYAFSLEDSRQMKICTSTHSGVKTCADTSEEGQYQQKSSWFIPSNTMWASSSSLAPSGLGIWLSGGFRTYLNFPQSGKCVANSWKLSSDILKLT